MQQPKLTVIMPVYNLAEYLPRALDALLHQDESNFKLLIIDDGSTDKTSEILQQYRPKFPYFTVIKTKNGGPSSARNIGLSQVDTPYFTFHDGDDFVDPGYVSFFLRAFKLHPDCDLVSCGYYIDRPKGRSHVVGKPESGVLTKGNAFMKLTDIFASPMKGYCWNKGYRTKLVRKHNLLFDADVAFMEDQIFNVKYISIARKVYYTQKPYYHYWQRSDSIVHRPNLKKTSDLLMGNYLIWSKIIKSIMKEREQEKAKKKANKILLKNSNID